MLEGVLRMADLVAGDVMVAEPRMDMLDIDAPYDEILATVIDTGHSRFPVTEGGRANIIGILLAKDLLKLQRAPELNIRALLRPAVFVPESKGLIDLLRDFRSNRNHLAIVIDEFGRTAGLITIEDVLEQIVGDIEDEYDFDDAADNIVGGSEHSTLSNDAFRGREFDFMLANPPYGKSWKADLERMGDLAVNIAQRAVSLMEGPIIKPMIDIPHIAGLVQSMVRKSTLIPIDSSSSRATSDNCFNVA